MVILGFSLGFWLTVAVLLALRLGWSAYNWYLVKQLESRIEAIEENL